METKPEKKNKNNKNYCNSRFIEAVAYSVIIEQGRTQNKQARKQKLSLQRTNNSQQQQKPKGRKKKPKKNREKRGKITNRFSW
jgi:hypothetical protein